MQAVVLPNGSYNLFFHSKKLQFPFNQKASLSLPSLITSRASNSSRLIIPRFVFPHSIDVYEDEGRDACDDAWSIDQTVYSGLVSLYRVTA